MNIRVVKYILTQKAAKFERLIVVVMKVTVVALKMGGYNGGNYYDNIDAFLLEGKKRGK